MTWMQSFFGIDAAAEVRKGLTISGGLLIVCALIQFLIAPVRATAGIDANVSFKQAPSESSVLDSDTTIVAEGKTISGLRSMTVAIEPASGSVPSLTPEASKTATYALGTTTGEISLTWTRNRTPYNGTYKIAASADSVLGEKATAFVSAVHVNIPPVKPSGLVARNEADAILVTWSPNLEPDLIGYKVTRATGASRTSLGLVQISSFKDEGAPKGVAVYYEVIAVRKSPLSSDGIASLPAASEQISLPLPDVQNAVATPLDVPALKQATAPEPVKAKTQTVVAPNRNVGFEEYLPYEQPIPMRIETPIEAPEEEISFPEEPASFQPLTARRVELIKYLAASFLLLVGALHTARMARKVLISI